MLVVFFDIDYDLIQIYKDKDFKLFFRDFIHIALKSSQNIKKFNIHHLIFELLILSQKNQLLFIFFSNSYLIIDISEI